MKQKNVLSKLEEKLIFPISKTTGRVFALFISLLIVIALVFLIYNSIPTSQRDVLITKSEILKNKIDPDATEETNSQTCNASESEGELQNLKNKLPNAEWVNLTETIDVFDGYDYITKYDPWYGSYQTYVPKYKKQIVKNYNAIPNKLTGLFEAKGIDSLMFCEKTEILKVLNKACELTVDDYKIDAFNRISNLYYSIDKISMENINDAITIRNKIKPQKSQLENYEDLNEFIDILNMVVVHKPKKERIDVFTKLIDENEKLNYAKKTEDQLNYGYVANAILRSDLPDEELVKASESFIKDLNFHSNRGFNTSLARYLNLYSEKFKLFSNEKAATDYQKSDYRFMSAITIGAGILALLLFAMVLLLFSINKSLSK